MPLLSRYFGFVREISFLSGRMKFRFAFDIFVFVIKNSIDPLLLFCRSIQKIREKERSRDFRGFLLRFLSFRFVHVETRVRKLFDGSLKNLFIV